MRNIHIYKHIIIIIIIIIIFNRCMYTRKLYEGPTGTNCTGGWVVLRAGLHTEAGGKILFLCWDSNPDIINWDNVVQLQRIGKK
jgi:hypothetical protein